MEGDLKSTIHKGDLLFSHFNLISGSLDPENNKAVTLRSGLTDLHSVSGERDKSLQTRAVAGGCRGMLWSRFFLSPPLP